MATPMIVYVAADAEAARRIAWEATSPGTISHRQAVFLNTERTAVEPIEVDGEPGVVLGSFNAG